MLHQNLQPDTPGRTIGNFFHYFNSLDFYFQVWWFFFVCLFCFILAFSAEASLRWVYDPCNKVLKFVQQTFIDIESYGNPEKGMISMTGEEVGLWGEVERGRLFQREVRPTRLKARGPFLTGRLLKSILKSSKNWGRDQTLKKIIYLVVLGLTCGRQTLVVACEPSSCST